MGNQYDEELAQLDAKIKQLDYELRLYRAIRQIRKHCPEWEYVGGFSDTNGNVTVRHTVCGELSVKSMTTLRHHKRSIECEHCIRKKQQDKQAEAERKRRIAHEMKTAPKRTRYEETGMKECPICGTFYFGLIRDRFCSEECKTRNQKRNANRYKETKKKRCRTKESKYINLLSLYQRDNGICWICGERCDITLDGNDDYYPSIDHVIPVSKGGMDEWSNVKLAHRICNLHKRDKIVDIRYPLGHFSSEAPRDRV